MAAEPTLTQTTAAEAHAANAEHGAAFPPFASETFLSQLIWPAIAYGLLYWHMAKVALPRIAGILHERSQRLSADLAEAERMRGEAQRAGAAYEAGLSEARDTAKRIAQEARTAAGAQADQRRKVLEGELNGRLTAAEATIRERTATAMGSVRAIAADSAGAIVERLIGQTPDQGTLDAALERTLAPARP